VSAKRGSKEAKTMMAQSAAFLLYISMLDASGSSASRFDADFAQLLFAIEKGAVVDGAVLRQYDAAAQEMTGDVQLRFHMARIAGFVSGSL